MYEVHQSLAFWRWMSLDFALKLEAGVTSSCPYVSYWKAVFLKIY